MSIDNLVQRWRRISKLVREHGTAEDMAAWSLCCQDAGQWRKSAGAAVQDHLKSFKIEFYGGDTEVVMGKDIDDAMKRAGYDSDYLNLINRWDEIEPDKPECFACDKNCHCNKETG